MSFTIDEQRDWESGWLKENPEPFIQPSFKRLDGVIGWRLQETIARVHWHRIRWEAFKTRYPTWKEITYGQIKGA